MFNVLASQMAPLISARINSRQARIHPSFSKGLERVSSVANSTTAAGVGTASSILPPNWLAETEPRERICS